MSTFSAIIVGAGRGTRLNASGPKAFIPLGDKPLFSHSISVFDAFAYADEIVLVVPPGYEENARSYIHHVSTPITIAGGGAQRWDSVRNGLNACDPSHEWVMIHDAARPFVTTQVIATLWEMRKKYRSAVTATPVVDTVRRADGDASQGTIDRSRLVRVGTPQLFDRKLLMRVFSETDFSAVAPTDEAQLMENAGIPSGIAQGGPCNFKITVPYDLTLAEVMYANQKTLQLGGE